MPPTPERLPPDPATILERSRGVLFAQWQELLRLRCTVLKTYDQDDIHDLRVATRRFRALLELFDPIAPKSAKNELKKVIRKITQVLGGLRNIDEALLFFPPRIDAETAAGGRLFQALSRLRSGKLKRIEKALIAFDQRTLDRMVREIVAALNEGCLADRHGFSLQAYFSETSIRQYLPIHRLLAVSMVPEQRESRHALRIAIKKWRYVLEIVSTVLDCDYSALLGLLKEYQSILGRMNDIAEFEILLKALELPRNERDQAEAILRHEDALLLEMFSELIERKPLVYTFLI